MYLNNSSLHDVTTIQSELLLSGSHIFISVNGIIIGILTVFLNVFVLVCLASESSEFDVTRAFLRNNAFADALAGILAIYQSIYNLILYEEFQECVFRSSLLIGILMASIMIIFGLNIERYIKIVMPFRHLSLITPWVVTVYLVVTWVTAIILTVIPNMLWIGVPPIKGICRFLKVFDGNYFVGLNFFTATMFFSQILMNSHIFIIAASKIITDRKARRNGVKETILPEWWKPARAVLLIVGVNLCTIAPMVIFILLFAFGHFKTKTDEELNTLSISLAVPCYLTSALNPLLYSFQIVRIREKFLGLFCRRRRTRIVDITITNSQH